MSIFLASSLCNHIFVKVLVDGPASLTGVLRQVITVKRISLTDIVVNGVHRTARQSTLEKLWKVLIVFYK